MLHLQYLEMDRLRPDNQIVAFLVFPIGWSRSRESGVEAIANFLSASANGQTNGRRSSALNCHRRLSLSLSIYLFLSLCLCLSLSRAKDDEVHEAATAAAAAAQLQNAFKLLVFVFFFFFFSSFVFVLVAGNVAFSARLECSC